MLGRITKALAGGRRGGEPVAAAVLASAGPAPDAYNDAMRHSRRVRALRRAIPVVCLAALAGPIAWGVISPFARVGLDVKVGPISVSGTKVTMEAPKLSGFKKDNKAYEVTAEQATQDIKAPTVVELSRLTARMEQEDKKSARLTSDWGRFDQSADTLELKGNVRVRTDNGYEADLASARVNVKTGDMVSAEPVTVRSLTGRISAERAEMRDNGRHAIFEGRVRSLFSQTDGPPPPAEPRTKTQ